MSYTMIVQHNIKLKADTPSTILDTLREWHSQPHAYDNTERLFDIDVYRALGPGCGGQYGNLKAECVFNTGSGVVSHIRTTAMFNRGRDGVDVLIPFFDFLADHVLNKDEVIAVIRGEDNLFDSNEGSCSGFGFGEPPEPKYGYYEVRIINGRAKIEYVANNIYELLPWVTYAY